MIKYKCQEFGVKSREFQLPVSYVLLSYTNRKIHKFCKDVIKKYKHI